MGLQSAYPYYQWECQLVLDRHECSHSAWQLAGPKVQPEEWLTTAEVAAIAVLVNEQD
jgi:hypothetical protein